jgi:hypothetical protein
MDDFLFECCFSAVHKELTFEDSSLCQINSALCGIAQNCDSVLCGITPSCDSALCRIARSRHIFTYISANLNRGVFTKNYHPQLRENLAKMFWSTLHYAAQCRVDLAHCGIAHGGDSVEICCKFIPACSVIS